MGSLMEAGARLVASPSMVSSTLDHHSDGVAGLLAKSRGVVYFVLFFKLSAGDLNWDPRVCTATGLLAQLPKPLSYHYFFFP